MSRMRRTDKGGSKTAGEVPLTWVSNLVGTREAGKKGSGKDIHKNGGRTSSRQLEGNQGIGIMTVSMPDN